MNLNRREEEFGIDDTDRKLYVEAMSNTPSGVLVEMRLYENGHRLMWLLARAKELLEKGVKKADWVVVKNYTAYLGPEEGGGNGNN